MAQRSFWITVENNTGFVWRLLYSGLSHGIWTSGGPPTQIDKSTLDEYNNPVSGHAEFGSESSGFATGTEGYAVYVVDPVGALPLGTMRIVWDNPFVGSNEFSVDLSPHFKHGSFDKSGDNATPTVTISFVR